MSFYIKVDNPRADRPAHLPHDALFLAEGSQKTCLVTAFTPAINDVPNADGPGFRRENCGVAVTLAGAEPILLPFMADEFEDLILDAQRKSKIADFTSDNWVALVDDLVAIRNSHQGSLVSSFNRDVARRQNQEHQDSSPRNTPWLHDHLPR
jgi:hypothetical protein